MANREALVRNFSACPLCGHFLASLLALLGDKSLDQPGRDESGLWLRFEWRSPMIEMLAKYYDWYLISDTELHANHCSVCRRRMVFENKEQESWLYVERQPGSRG